MTTTSEKAGRGRSRLIKYDNAYQRGDRSAPKSVLARHYTDFSSEKLKEIYEKVNIRILRARDTSSY